MAIAFFVSSVGDAELAKATILRMVENHFTDDIVVVPLAEAALKPMNDLAGPQIKHRRLSHMLSDESTAFKKVLSKNELDEITGYLKDQRVDLAYVGVSSPNDEEAAFQLTAALSASGIPCTVACEFMFTVPKEHKFWEYVPALLSSPQVALSVPLASAKQGLPPTANVLTVGHLSIDQAVSAQAADASAHRALLHVSETDDLVFISGTTQPTAVDAAFLEALLSELNTGKYPHIQIRFGLHPGVKDFDAYLPALLAICEKYPNTAAKFKIVLPSAIEKKLQSVDISKMHPFILRCEISGSDMANAADKVGQAVPGALTNRAAMLGKPTFFHNRSVTPFLPHEWFSADLQGFLLAGPSAPHQREELGLSTDAATHLSQHFFKQSELQKFKQLLQQYAVVMMQNPVSLTDAECEQLMWYMNTVIVTPEATEAQIQEKLHFEIKRGLSRRYCFELVLRGDDSAYQEFVSEQAGVTQLSRDSFQQLSVAAHALSEDSRAAIRATCFLTLSDKAKQVAVPPDANGFSKDSEEFLTQLTFFLPQNQRVFPVLKSLSAEQLMLLKKAFWPNMHFRHMMYTEGGVGMTKTFMEGVLSGEFTKHDFEVWKWRWLTNLFGFQLGRGAKYFNAEVFELCATIVTSLQTIFDHPRENRFLETYLLERAGRSGINEPTEKAARLLLGHIVAYFNQVTVLTPELGQAVLSGYQAFCHDHPDNRLAFLYARAANDAATITPTYVPAVLNNAYAYFKKTMRVSDAIRQATEFMCQFLVSLYQCSLTERISCMALAQEKTLVPVLESWLSDRSSVVFDFTDGVAKRRDLVTAPTLH